MNIDGFELHDSLLDKILRHPDLYDELKKRHVIEEVEMVLESPQTMEDLTVLNSQGFASTSPRGGVLAVDGRPAFEWHGQLDLHADGMAKLSTGIVVFPNRSERGTR